MHRSLNDTPLMEVFNVTIKFLYFGPYKKNFYSGIRDEERSACKLDTNVGDLK